jgi:hypothetical protein
VVDSSSSSLTTRAHWGRGFTPLLNHGNNLCTIRCCTTLSSAMKQICAVTLDIIRMLVVALRCSSGTLLTSSCLQLPSPIPNQACFHNGGTACNCCYTGLAFTTICVKPTRFPTTSDTSVPKCPPQCQCNKGSLALHHLANVQQRRSDHIISCRISFSF